MKAPPAPPGPPAPPSDPARRCSDIVTQAIVDGYAGWWVAIRLSDGGSDGTLYASREAAIRYQLHETLCAYVCIPYDSMTPREADIFLKFHRHCYDAGYRLQDPGDPEPVIPANLENLPPSLRTSR